MSSAPRPQIPRGSHPHGASAVRPRRNPWRFALVAVVLLLPIAEIFLFVAAGRAIGIWWTIGLLVVLSLTGAWLMKREGTATWRALRDSLRAGQMPGREAADAALVLVGGGLLLLPGFLTDVVGLFLILPITRPIARDALRRSAEKRVMAQAGVIRSVRVDSARVDGDAPSSGNPQIPHIDLRRD